MNQTPKKSRSNLLTLLCIGSATFGISWIVMFLVMIAYSLKSNLPSGLFPGIAVEYLHAGYIFLISIIFLTGIGLFAVLKMWQLKKSGFYLYATIKVMIYFLPIVFIGNQHITYPGLIITSVLITAYGTLITRL